MLIAAAVVVAFEVNLFIDSPFITKMKIMRELFCFFFFFVSCLRMIKPSQSWSQVLFKEELKAEKLSGAFVGEVNYMK